MYKGIKKLFLVVVITLSTTICAYAGSEYCISGAMITGYNGNADVVVVPAVIDGVQIAGIDTGAFQNKDMHTVIIEEGIEVIQPKAFVGCNSLQYVKSPDSMLLINENAFFECSPLLCLDVSESTYVMDQDREASLFEEEVESESYNGFLYSDKTITGYIGEETDIIIPDSINDVTITTIGASAFEGNTAITSVVIPDTVTTIGGYAFKGCTALSEVTLTKKLSSAGVEVFSGCSALKSITIPGTLKRVSKNMFYECRSLTDVVLESGVNIVKQHAFYNCKNLENVQVPETITMLETWAFGFCEKLDSFYIPNGCTFVDSATFYYCTTLNNIHIPDTVTTLGTQCFRECWNLSDITLSNSLGSIQYRTFHNCSFFEIEIPDSVTKIGKGAFYQCKQLKNIEIPETVMSIDTGAFYGCSSLENLIIYGTECTLTDIYTEDRTGVVNRGEKIVLYVVENSVSEKCAKESEYPYKSISGTANVIKTNSLINGAANTSEGNTVLVEGDSVYVKYTVINVGEESQNLRLLICIYDEKGRFIKFACSSPDSVAVNSLKEIEASVEIAVNTDTTEDSEAGGNTELSEDAGAEEDSEETTDNTTENSSYYAKVMLISDLEKLVPLYELKEI